MVLQNYWAWKKIVEQTMSTGSVSASGMKAIDGTSPINVYTGYVQSCALLFSTVYGAGTYAGHKTYILLGSGTTEPAATDYSLETDESANFTITGTNTTNYDSGSLQILFALTATNTSASDITISEIGVMKQIQRASNTDQANQVLLTRDVLNTPITFAAGETKTINYVWTMQ